MTAHLKKNSLTRLCSEFHKQGYLIIPDFFPTKTIRKWHALANAAFDQSAFEFAKNPKYSLKHKLRCHVVHRSFVVLRPYPSTVFLSNDVFGNPQLQRIVSTILNHEDHYTPIYDIGFNFHGKKAQHIHRDFSPIFPEMKEPLPTTAVSVSIPLVDMDVSNGVLELWPGTHKIIDSRLGFMDSLDDLVCGKKSVRPKIPSGSLFLRDTRLIHRGMPNPRGDPRPWLSSIWVHPLIYFPNKISVSKPAWRKLNSSGRKQLRYAEIMSRDPWQPRLNDRSS